jgi:hypothetical protein
MYSASPTGEYKAIVFTRHCGATTGTSHVLLVLRADEPANGQVSPLAIEAPYPSGQGFTEQDYREIVRIALRWIAPDTLEASVDSRAEVFRGKAGVPDGVGLNVKFRCTLQACRSR